MSRCPPDFAGTAPADSSRAAASGTVAAAPDPYLVLKLARELYGKAPAALSASENARVAVVAGRQSAIEQRLLQTPEAAGVVLPDAVVAHALAEIRARYTSADEYEADLSRCGLDHERLRAAIVRDLKVEAVLEQVAARAPAANETEVEIFYLMHIERFRQAEKRTLRHILLTINDELAGSERASARQRIDAIRAQLASSPERFREYALKHSECPTALDGGLLGEVTRGKLYPEIEAVAFALAAGELSAVVESPMGVHLVLCERISEAATQPLDQVRQRIREHIDSTRRAALQKAWLARLFKPA